MPDSTGRDRNTVLPNSIAIQAASLCSTRIVPKSQFVIPTGAAVSAAER